MDISLEQQISDIQNQQIEKENQLDTLYARKFELKKELVEISEGIRKGEHSLSVLKTQEKLLNRQFWANLKGRA